MILLVSGLAFADAIPAVRVAWKRDRMALLVDAPGGYKIGSDAPLSLHVQWEGGEHRVDALGADAARGLGLPDLRGLAVTGEVRVPLCDLDGSTCTLRDYALSGTIPQQTRGEAPLTVTRRVADLTESFRVDANAVAQRAFDEATRAQQRLLLDFSAIWCPPCNQLALEVLHADPPPAELLAASVAVLDVDDPSSWSLKSKYGVGGYPTIIVALPDGSEVARLEGYPGKEAFLSWLSASLVQDVAADPMRVDPATLAPDAAADLAWRLAQNDDTRAAAYVEVAAAGGYDGVDLRLARMRLQPNAEDARWLVAQHPERAVDWVEHALSGAPDELNAIGREAVAAALPLVDGIVGADLTYLLATAATDSEATALYGRAAALLSGALSGDVVRDRPHLTFLAKLLAKSGDLSGGLARLDGAKAVWPHDPTWDLAAAGLLLDAGQPEAALARAEAGLPIAWGDILLRLATAKARALDALGRSEEAARYAASVLEAIPEPIAELNVRTHKYREALSKYLAEP